jgi:hypothetical protein
MKPYNEHDGLVFDLVVRGSRFKDKILSHPAEAGRTMSGS